MKLLKENKVSISGNVAHVDIKQGTHGPFGNVLIIADDGYFQKGQNGNGDTWVERSYPISIKVNSNIIKQAGQAGFNVGDFLAVEGKNIVEFGKGPNGEPDTNKKYPKVEAKVMLQHLPAYVAKQLREEIKAEKQQGNNQSQNQNGGGGYQQQNNQPQNQNRNGAYQPNGRQQNQNHYANQH